jgi:hypothetical protein
VEECFLAGHMEVEENGHQASWIGWFVSVICPQCFAFNFVLHLYNITKMLPFCSLSSKSSTEVEKGVVPIVQATILGRKEVTIGVPPVVPAMTRGRKEVNIITEAVDLEVAVLLLAIIIMANVTTVINTTKKILSNRQPPHIDTIITVLLSVFH